jgi:hypothetical protein
MPSLSLRENYLRALRHEETEYVPLFLLSGGDVALCGVLPPVDRGYESSGFVDSFGIRWVSSESVAGAALPAPGEFLLKDITRWKKTLTLPNVEQYDWQKFAEEEEAMFKIDRDKQVVYFWSYTGIWERLAALMGFEEAMIALVEEPEACNDLFAAITDYKIKVAEKAAKYYKADAFVNCDDIATERQLFMSPETYRQLIKPHHKRLNDAVKNFGMIPIQHTCGHAELCVEDYIETGAVAWNSVQPSNDIAGLLDNYGDKLSFEGGFDSTGKPSWPSASTAEIQAEVERCFHEYSGKKGYIFMGFLLAPVNDKEAEQKTTVIAEAFNKLRFAGK